MSYWTGVSGMISLDFMFESGTAERMNAGVLFKTCRERAKEAMGATLAVVTGKELDLIRQEFGSDREITYILNLDDAIADGHDGLAGKVSDAFDACANKVPTGSEGSIQYSVTPNEFYWCDSDGHRSAQIKLIIPFWGNLRDFEPKQKPELTNWFNKVIGKLNTGWIQDGGGISHSTIAHGNMVVSDQEGEPTLHLGEIVQK